MRKRNHLFPLWKIKMCPRAFLHSSSFTSIHLQFLPLQLLLRNFFLFWFSRRFGKSLLFFNQTHFNVAWRRHVWVDTTMSPINLKVNVVIISQYISKFMKKKKTRLKDLFQSLENRSFWANQILNYNLPISSSAHFGSTVYLNMIDDQMISIQTLVFSIRFGVFQLKKEEI